MRTVEEIEKELENAKERLFLEEMADFMNWDAYRHIKGQIEDLEKELSEVRNERKCN